MKRNIQKTLAALTALALCAAPAGAAELTKEPLSAVLAKVSAKSAVLVDVREKAEWDDGHVAGAILLPLSELEDGTDAKRLAAKLPKGKTLYTYCVVGQRAVTAGKILEKHGYTVKALKPGYEDLVEAGFGKAK